MAKPKNPPKKAMADPPVSMESLKTFVRSRGVDYLRDPNISSVGIGYKVKDGKMTNEISVQFTVNQKSQPEMLEAAGTQLIPDSFEIDGIIVPTDVLQRTYETSHHVVAEAAASNRKKRLNPIVPGVSVANTKVSAGTIGCIVFDQNNGTPYVLSNWHVLNGPTGVLGDDVVQPGPADDNRVQLNRMGKLVRSHLGHAGDCAVASIEDRQSKAEILDLGIKPEQLAEAELGDKVIKSGRTTGVTHGIVRRVLTIAKINYGGVTGEQEIGCFEIGVDPNHPSSDGQISKGGDSGSVWMIKGTNGKASKTLAGLHFAGEGPGNPDEHALACYPKSVFEKLEISLSAVPSTGVGQPGYNPSFLFQRVPLPDLTQETLQDAFQKNGSPVIAYTHFSLAMSKARRFCRWVAWNIDGGSLKSLSRRGIPFVLDPNLPAAVQVGDDLYRGNRLDRGHIARRADLLWGPPAEAKKANVDSFFFTNITPQMDDFNQGSQGGVWGRLEDAIFADVDVEDLKVSVFGGPVFRDDDRVFRQIRIPREFWKIIAFVEAGKLKCKGFLLTQNLNALETLDLDAFKVFEVGLGEIEQRTGVRFPAVLKTTDHFGEALINRPEAIDDRQPIARTEDIAW